MLINVNYNFQLTSLFLRWRQAQRVVEWPVVQRNSMSILPVLDKLRKNKDKETTCSMYPLDHENFFGYVH